MRITGTILAGLLLFCGFLAPRARAADVLLPHRAVYELTLDKATDRSGINTVDGRMVYEFAGSVCDGYTVRFRYVTQIDTDDTSRLSDLQTTAYEDGLGRNFRFASKSYVDQKLDKEVKGEAIESADGTQVKLEKPQARSMTLPKALFPTAHLLQLLKKARAGEHFYQTQLFDGADDADKVMTTTVVVGKPQPVAKDDPERAAMKSLASDEFWPVNIAYFSDGGDKKGEETPDYDVSFKLHKSGITRDLTMDYGEFSIRARLVDLTLFDPESACKTR